MKLTKILIILITLFFSLSAKFLDTRNNASKVFYQKKTYTEIKEAVQDFEKLLLPYFQLKSKSITKTPKFLSAPSQEDLYSIAIFWNMLSQNFKDIYLKATQIPSDMKKYISPSGHFEIYYYSSGPESVDLTDTIQYSSSNWRQKLFSPNGIPDYIDEVAFAADSTWSMEIENFGFKSPWPEKDNNHPSDRYKISIRLLNGIDSTTYAYTYPRDPAPSPNIGFRSYIEMRSEWNSPAWNQPPKDYKTYPEKAVRVTCAHEFFHAIQYSMIHFTRSPDMVNIFLDNFPVSFTEGTAVLMEDLGFDYVNDYIQYIGKFFNNPYSTLFSQYCYSNDDAYKNSLLAMFIFQRLNGIAFFYDMYFNNYKSVVPFLDNISYACQKSQTSWANIIGNFFVESYYTGKRSVKGLFIKDASILGGEWNYSNDILDKNMSVRKNINPFGMNTFCFDNSMKAKNLSIYFYGDSIQNDKDTSELWKAFCILKKDTNPANDSIFPLNFFSKSHAKAVISSGNNFSSALVVGVNPRYDTTRNATCCFLPCDLLIQKGQTITFTLLNGNNISSDAKVQVYALENLSCSLYIKIYSPSSVLLDQAKKDSLAFCNTLFSIEFPLPWSFDANMNLYITEKKDKIKEISDFYSLSDSLFDICRWDEEQKIWRRCKSKIYLDQSYDTIYYTRYCRINNPGIYGLFGLLPNAERDSLSITFSAFPNPVRLSSDKRICFRGKNLLEIWIYTIEGNLISHAIKGMNYATLSFLETTYGFDWRLTNISGKNVSPGIYYAKIGYKDEKTKGMVTKLKKIYIIP